MFTSKKPNVSHFRIFGSPIYFHVPKEKRNKLGASGNKGIFVGYSENTKGYRIYVVGQRKVEISHDVTFDEDMALSKVDNLPTLRGSKEADTEEPKDKEDETMPDVEEPMDPIDPPLQERSSSRKRPSWLRGALDDAEGHIAPRGTFCESKKPNRVKKALYGLKQAPRAWYERIDSYLMKLGFTRSEADPNLYFKVIDDKPLILVLYVGNLFLTSADPLIHELNTLSQHMVEPHHSHWIGDKNLLRYLRGTITHGLRYTAEDVRLLGYTDVDWAGNVVDRKSTFGCCFSLGSASISWMSRKQKSVALSTAEAEYIAANMASYEAVWL
eukprot:PITA_16366